MLLTGGQSRMNFDALQSDDNASTQALSEESLKNISMLSIEVDDEDLKAHNARLEEIQKISGKEISWN